MRSLWLILVGVVIGVLGTLPLWLGRGAAPAPVGDSLAERELNRVIPAVDIEGLPFDQAVAEVQKLTRARITVDWYWLAVGGIIAADTRVTMHGTNVYLWQVMDQLVLIASRTHSCSPCDYQPLFDCIEIKTSAALSQHVSARVYDVQDWLPHGEDLKVHSLQNAPSPGSAEESTDDLVAFVLDGLRTRLGDGEPMVATNHAAWASAPWALGSANFTTLSYPAAHSIHRVGNRLYVVANWSTHHQIQRFLYDLSTLNSGPSPAAQNSWSEFH